MNGLDFGTAIGLIKGLGSPDPAVIESAVSDWLDDHPEATTTVQDGSITKAKLDSNLQGTVDDVADLKSQKADVELALGAYPTDTVSGAVATFTDGGDNLPVKDLTIGINPVQSGSGGPSPDNVRPISGWTGANVNANGTSIPITFPSEAGTVYGGTLDVTTDVLTVDRAMVNMDTLTWQYFPNTNPPHFGATVSNIKLPIPNGNLICSCYKTVVGSPYANANNTIRQSGEHNNKGIKLSDTRFTSQPDFVAWLNTAHPQLVYSIDAPHSYPLDPIEVLTLLGANTIYADTGDILSLTYRADPTLYADKRSNATRSIIAGIEPTMTASKAYTVGQLLIVGDTLYKVAASIASGATLTPGTNVNATTVAEQLILLANA